LYRACSSVALIGQIRSIQDHVAPYLLWC
jgi:hypothetical protein